MSDYPHTPYGAGYNPQDQNNPPYLPPAYPNQYPQQNDGLESQGHVPSGYNASMAAYGYNNALPAFGAAAVSSGVPPLPMFTGWNQDATQIPAYNNSQQYPGYGNGTAYNSQYYQQTTPANYQQNIPQAKPFEADLSEGEFEGSAVAINTPPLSYGSAQYQDRDRNGYYNTAQRAVHSRAQDYSPQQSSYSANNSSYPVPETSHNKRQKSGSYSPYVSPSVGTHVPQHRGEPSNDTSAYTPSHAPEAFVVASQIQPSSGPQILADSSCTNPLANGFSTSQNGADTEKYSYPSHPAQGVPASAGRSVAESRKKAQGAILSLWPHDVRYQTYMDEGFKMDTVDKLFDDLHLPKITLPSRNVIEQVPSFEAQLKIPKSGSPSRLPNGANALNSQPSTKISVLAPSSVKAIVDPKLAASEEMVEKQKKLETKMELLRRSREERAQKAAAAKNVRSSSATISGTIGNGFEPVSHSEKTTSMSNSPQAEVQPQPQVSAPAIPGIKSESQASNIPGIQSLPQSSRLSQLHTLSPTESRPLSQPSSQSTLNPVSMSIQQQTPSIPGLFLGLTGSAPTPPPPTVSKDAPASSTHLNHRKRPVAADFDGPITTMASFKRPFGHTRIDQPLVIHVSEDEDSDEDVAMDIESSQADQDSPVQTSFQNLPPPNFPVRRPIATPPTISTSTTPPVGPSLDQSQALQSKIEELKQKIARAEAAKKAKRTPNGNGTRTPQRSETAGSDMAALATTSNNAASTVEAMIQIQQEIGVADNAAALDEQRLADEQNAEVQKAADLKKSQAEQRRLQRSKMASDISLIEAETARQKAELEKLRADMAEREAALQKGLEDRRRMAEEMERLGQEAEDQLQAENSKLEAPIGEGGSSKEPLIEAPITAPENPSLRSSEHPSSHQVSARQSVEPHEFTKQASSSIIPSFNAIDHEQLKNTVSQESSTKLEGRIEEASADGKVIENTISNDQALEAALQEAVRAQADSHSQDDGEIDEAHMDEEAEMGISFAPNPSQLAPESPASPMRDIERSPTYSPVLNRNVTDAEDDYEPPDATPIEPIVTDSPPFSPAPPAIVDESQAGDEEMPEVSLPEAVDKQTVAELTEETPNVNGWLQQVYGTRVPKVPSPVKSRLFTPYESPLKNFHAYRFHSEYPNNVSGGLRSITYSNKIDPNLEFCRYELAGGICNDPTCTEQHFRDIKLPDDAVLTALGSPEEFVGDQRDEFCKGLKEVLVNLRVRKIRDFDIIAKEIVAHRANFLGDKSKVLPLEGVQL